MVLHQFAQQFNSKLFNSCNLETIFGTNSRLSFNAVIRGLYHDVSLAFTGSARPLWFN